MADGRWQMAEAGGLSGGWWMDGGRWAFGGRNDGLWVGVGG